MNFFTRLRHAFLREDGTSTIEFVIVVPTFLLIFVSIFELGMAMTRLTMLEHSLDVTMREIRIGTGQVFTHDQIRNRVCENAGYLKDCGDGKRLLLEMVRIERDNWVMPPREATCITDQSAGAARPVTTFDNGAPSDVMFIRACFVVEPIFPTFGLGAIVETDSNGNMHLVANSAFAQEP